MIRMMLVIIVIEIEATEKKSVYEKWLKSF